MDTKITTEENISEDDLWNNICSINNTMLKHSKYRWSSEHKKLNAKICDMICDYYFSISTLSSGFIDKFITDYCLCRSYSYMTPIKYGSVPIINCLSLILSNWTINYDLIIKLLDHSMNCVFLLNVLITRDDFNKFPNKMLDLLWDNKNMQRNKTLVEILLHNTDINFNNKKMYIWYSKIPSYIIGEFIKKSSYKFTQKHLYYSCIGLPYSIHIFNALLEKGLYIDSICLEHICEEKNYHALEIILKYKILITKKHFNICVKNKQKGMIKLLLNHNYILDKDDIIYCMQNNIYIENITQYTNIPITIDIMKYAWGNGFYPNYNIESNNLNDELYINIINNNVPKIKMLLKQINNPVIDESILKYIQCNKHKIISLVYDYIKYVSYDTIIALTKTHNDSLMLLLQKYKECKDKEISDLKNNVSKLEEKLAKYEDICDDLEDDTKVNDNNNNNNIKFADIDVSNIIINSKSRADTPPQKYIKYMKEKKNIKLSYFDIRKKIVDDIIKSDMYYNNNKSIINPTDDLKKILEIDGCVKISDLDKLVMLFYK